MKNQAGAVLLITVISAAAYAGGNPEFVKYPEGYKDTFIRYHGQNRANNTQVADFYANATAINSLSQDGRAAAGSVIVMEIYQTETGEDGKPVLGADNLFKRTDLAGIAVMEKRAAWDAAYTPEHRSGNWGFALYDTQGQPKENDLVCTSCHAPLLNQDYLFTFPKLSGQ